MKTYREFMSEASKSPFISKSVKKLSSALPKSKKLSSALPKPERLNIKSVSAGSLVPGSLKHKNIMGLSKEVKSKAKKTVASIGSSIAKKIGL